MIEKSKEEYNNVTRYIIIYSIIGFFVLGSMAPIFKDDSFSNILGFVSSIILGIIAALKRK